VTRALHLAAALVFASGCSFSAQIARLTVVDLDRAPGGGVVPVRNGTVTGLSCRWWILGAPLGLPSIDEAVANALRFTGTRELAQVEIWSIHPVYGPVGRHCYGVTGVPVDAGPTPELAPPVDPSAQHVALSPPRL
jgi:hypothetical protein